MVSCVMMAQALKQTTELENRYNYCIAQFALNLATSQFNSHKEIIQKMAKRIKIKVENQYIK